MFFDPFCIFDDMADRREISIFVEPCLYFYVSTLAFFLFVELLL
jgi:hypothetical protein